MHLHVVYAREKALAVRVQAEVAVPIGALGVGEIEGGGNRAEVGDFFLQAGGYGHALDDGMAISVERDADDRCAIGGPAEDGPAGLTDDGVILAVWRGHPHLVAITEGDEVASWRPCRHLQ